MSGGIGTGSRSSINRLSDIKIRAFLKQAKAGTAETKKLGDGGGLYLTTTPAGSPVWRLKYRYAGKEKLYAIGVYPEISLETARDERKAVRSLLRLGRDPVKMRQLNRIAATVASHATFASATAEWLAKQKKGWSEIHYTKSSQALERDVLPTLGNLPVSEITPGMIKQVITPILSRGANETASKILWNIRCIFNYASIDNGLTSNPAEPVREMLPKKKKEVKRPALLDFGSLGDFLRRADVAPLSPVVRLAHRLCAFTAARIGNVISAEWKEFDLTADVPTWIIPRHKMKAKDRDHDHKVLLGPTIAAELRWWKSATGGTGNVFNSPTGKGSVITHESIEKAYRVTLGMDGKHSPHGWRSAFSTLTKEDGGFDPIAVELALDHEPRSDVARAYDRGQRLEDRVELVYWWDSQLSSAQNGTQPISSQTKAGGSLRG